MTAETGRSAQKISVVIPTYNRAADVVRAIRSALAQTLPPHQVIVVDDGSTDDTEAAVAALGAPAVTYLRKKNGGVSSARNLGFEQVSGDLVALLDSDDYWSSDWLESGVRAMAAQPGTGAAICTKIWTVSPDGSERSISEMKARGEHGVVPLSNLLTGSAVGSNLLVRTDVLRAAGPFDTGLVTGEDIDFMLRVAAATSVAAVTEPLIFITQSTGSLSKNVNTGNRLRVYDKFEQQHPAVARQHRAAFRAARAETTLGYARDLTVTRHLGEARSRAWESWRYQPSSAATVQLCKIAVLSLLRTLGR